MSSVISKNNPLMSEVENINKKDSKVREDIGNGSLVTSFIYLKPTHSAGTVDKEVVLRRIRRRKRMNKFQTAIQSLLGSLFRAKSDQVSVQKRWLDDAFAGP